MAGEKADWEAVAMMVVVVDQMEGMVEVGTKVVMAVKAVAKVEAETVAGLATTHKCTACSKDCSKDHLEIQFRGNLDPSSPQM